MDAGFELFMAQVVPFLNWFPAKNIIKYYLVKLLDMLYAAMIQIVNLKYIVLKDTALADEFTKRDLELKGIANEKGINSPEYRAGREAHKAALAIRVRSLLVPALPGVV